MTGDLAFYRPGEELTATLVADADGNAPTRGEPLEIVGEGPHHPQVSSVSGPGNFVATLVDLPPDYDGPTEGLTQGDVIGPVTVRVTHYIEWIPMADAATIAAGDMVVVDADGARAYDAVGGDTVDMAIGPAWKTSPADTGTAGKVAVVRAGR